MADYAQASSAFDPSAQGAAYAQQLFALQQAMQGGGGGGGGNYASGGGSETNIDITGMRLLNDEKMRAARQMGAYGAQMDKKAADAAHARELELLQMREAMALDRSDKEFGQAKELEGMKFGQGMQLEEKRFGNEMAIAGQKNQFEQNLLTKSQEHDRKMMQLQFEEKQRLEDEAREYTLEAMRAPAEAKAAIFAKRDEALAKSRALDAKLLAVEARVAKDKDAYAADMVRKKAEYTKRRDAHDMIVKQAESAANQVVPTAMANLLTTHGAGLGAGPGGLDYIGEGIMRMGEAMLGRDNINDMQIGGAITRGFLSPQVMAAARQTMGDRLKNLDTTQVDLFGKQNYGPEVENLQAANTFAADRISDLLVKTFTATGRQMDQVAVTDKAKKVIASMQILEAMPSGTKDQSTEVFNSIRNSISDLANQMYNEPGHEAEVLDVFQKTLSKVNEEGLKFRVASENPKGFIGVNEIANAALGFVGQKASAYGSLLRQAGHGQYNTLDTLNYILGVLDEAKGNPQVIQSTMQSTMAGPMGRQLVDLSNPLVAEIAELLQTQTDTTKAKADLAAEEKLMGPDYSQGAQAKVAEAEILARFLAAQRQRRKK